MKIQHLTSTILLTLFLVSCNNGPKVIKAQSNENSSGTESGIFSEDSGTDQSTDTFSSFSEDLHSVVVNEVITASRFV